MSSMDGNLLFLELRSIQYSEEPVNKINQRFMPVAMVID